MAVLANWFSPWQVAEPVATDITGVDRMESLSQAPMCRQHDAGGFLVGAGAMRPVGRAFPGGLPWFAMTPTPMRRPADTVALTPVAGVWPYYGMGTGEHAEKMRVAQAAEESWENYEQIREGGTR